MQNSDKRDNIISFLIKAKRATYAGKGAETVPSRVGSHDLIYEEGNHMYYDTYPIMGFLWYICQRREKMCWYT